jgi:hypothetical protein
MAMHEVTIPLRVVDEYEDLGTPEDFVRLVQDSYCSQYLGQLGIASTPANKAAVMRCRPLDNCEIHGVWEEGLEKEHSAMAMAVKIVPIRRRQTRSQGASHRHAERIYVRMPQTPGRTLSTHREGSEIGTPPDTADPSQANALGGEPLPPLSPRRADNAIAVGGGVNELLAELEKVRNVTSEKDSKSARDGGNQRNTANMSGTAALEMAQREVLEQELAALKSKFIWPFACERPGRLQELAPWPSEGPMHIVVPPALRSEIVSPIGVELEEVRKNAMKYVEEKLPIGLLTSLQEKRLFSDVRAALCEPEDARGRPTAMLVAKLTGVLAHLLYWLTLGTNRRPGDARLTEETLQQLFRRAHEMWTKFEMDHRCTALGVSFVMPCLMLTVKRGIERCFESQYPDLMAVMSLRLEVVDRINTLMMRLFDPDCGYARFCKLDGTAKALALSRKLDIMRSASGYNRVKRLHSRAHRSTPLVQCILSTAGGPAGDSTAAGDAAKAAAPGMAESSSSAPPAAERKHGTTVVPSKPVAEKTRSARQVCRDPRTRRMMLNNDTGGAPAVASVVHPPQDDLSKKSLFRHAMERLNMEQKVEARDQRPSVGPLTRRPGMLALGEDE